MASVKQIQEDPATSEQGSAAATMPAAPHVSIKTLALKPVGKGKKNNPHKLLLPSGVSNARVDEYTSAMMRGLIGNVSYRLRLTLSSDFASNVSGTVNTQVPLDPQTYQNFDACQLLFDEIRVISGKVHWMPDNRYTKSATSRPMVTAFDNDSNSFGASVSYNAVWQYGTAELFNIDDPHTFSWKRPDLTPAAYWRDIADTVQEPGSVPFYSTGLSLSTNYGRYFSEIEVECRSTR
jgi:hypothetical protein